MLVRVAWIREPESKAVSFCALESATSRIGFSSLLRRLRWLRLFMMGLETRIGFSISLRSVKSA